MVPLLLQFQSTPLPGIVTAFDVVKDICSRLGSRLVLLPVHPFPFERPKEALGSGIVGTTAHRAHAANHLVRIEKPLVFLGGKLTAPIRAQNNRRPSLQLPHRHQLAWTTSWRS